MSGVREAVLGELEAWRDGSSPQTLNKSMHWDEINPTTSAMFADPTVTQHSYYANNVVELNTFYNIHNCPFFVYGGMTNGAIYMTGSQYMGNNYIQKNYFYDCQVNGTAIGYDTWLLLGDGFMDSATAVQNMVHNWQGGDAVIEFAEVWNLNCNQPLGVCSHRANVIQNSTYSMMDNTVATGAYFSGNIDLSLPSPAGNINQLSMYQEMWCILDTDELPGTHPLAGEDAMQTSLASIITALGGSLPTACVTPTKKLIGNASQFRIYPNPTTGEIYIDSPTNTSLKEINIFNISGQLMKSLQDDYNLNMIDISGLPVGVYFIRLTDQNQQTASQKIIKIE